MSKLYYKQNSQWINIEPEDFEAAPQNHRHINSSFGIIKQANGGIQNNENVKLNTFIGPLLYYNSKDLDQQNYHNKQGVYFGYTEDDTHVSIGTPSWEQGGIPYNTESEQLEHLYRQVPLNSSVFIPYAVVNGMLSTNGRWFYIPLRIYYTIPDGTQSISISGKYVIRQKGIYLFTSGKNYFDNDNNKYIGWGMQFDWKPTNIYAWQTMVPYDNTTDSGWIVSYDPQYDQYGGCIQIVCIAPSSSPQTTEYKYQSETASGTTTYVAQGYSQGVALLADIKLTFNDTPATVTPVY